MPKVREPVPQPEDHAVLQYGKHLVRAKRIDGNTFFAAEDIAVAANYALAAEFVARHPDHCPSVPLSSGDEWREVDMVSSLGAQTIAAKHGDKAASILYLWVRKQDALLRDNGDTFWRPPIEMLLDGHLPPSPGQYSAQYSEWTSLREQQRRKRPIYFDGGRLPIGIPAPSTDTLRT